MYICLDCGKTFEEYSCEEQYRGECFGFPAYETVTACPYCGGDFEEAQQCFSCSKYFLEDEDTPTGEFCKKCHEDILQKYRRDAAAVYKRTAEKKATVEISDFLAWALEPGEIEEILLDALVRDEKYAPFAYVNYSDYIDNDMKSFVDD